MPVYGVSQYTASPAFGEWRISIVSRNGRRLPRAKLLQLSRYVACSILAYRSALVFVAFSSVRISGEYND
jgi:hypothetical protein